MQVASEWVPRREGVGRGRNLDESARGGACETKARAMTGRRVGEPMSKRKRWLESEIGAFVRQYARRHHPGTDPNDRRYDREVEQIVRKMSPAVLDELMHGDRDGPGP